MERLYYPLIIVFTLLANSVSAQHRSYRDVENFDKVSVGSGITLYLIQGTKNEIEIISKYSYINKIVTMVQGGHLQIFSNQKNSWSADDAPKVYLTFQQINEINCGSATDVTCENIIRAPKLTVKTDGGADILVTPNVANLKLYTKGGSNIRAIGRAYKVEAELEDGSSIDTRELISESVKITSLGGSKAKVNPGKNFTAISKDGSTINYYGKPSWTDFTQKTGGKISEVEE